MNVLMVVMMTNKPCLNCQRFFNEHSNDELLECGLDIIKGVKDLNS